MIRSHIPRPLRTATEIHFQGRCAYCRSPQALMNVTFEVGHIVPEQIGGVTAPSNLALSCPLCNSFKGSRTHGLDQQTGTRIRLFHPRTQTWSRHFEWTEDGTTISGRTRSGRATVDALQLNNVRLVRLRIIWLAIGSSPPHWLTPTFVGGQSG